MNLKKTNITDIRVVYKLEEFEMFYAGLSENVKKKFDYVYNVIESTKVILLNAFVKKSTKDYRKKIEKAENILNSLEL